jgi:uncharacterized membrane protein
MEILGVEVPDSRPVFLVALAVHVAAAATAVVAGAVAAFSRKGPGRHPRAGTIYVGCLAAVFATATVMAALRWRHDWHLFVIATVACGSGGLGWLARRRRWHRWLTWHGAAMGASYVGLLTGFYVDNGARLPVWERLPHLTYWLLPAAVGIPVTVTALARNGAIRVTRPRRGVPRTAAPPLPPDSTVPR